MHRRKQITRILGSEIGEHDYESYDRIRLFVPINKMSLDLSFFCNFLLTKWLKSMKFHKLMDKPTTMFNIPVNSKDS